MFERGCLFLDKARFEKAGFFRTRISRGSDTPGLSQLTSACILFCDVQLFFFSLSVLGNSVIWSLGLFCMLVCLFKTLGQLFQDLSVCLVMFVVVVLCFY